MSGSGRGRGDRGLHQRVKTARHRKDSSTRWLERHINDPYVHRSKLEGYRSRAAYKLIEINDRYKLLKPAATGSTDEMPTVVGIDYLEMDPLPGVVFLQKDFLDDDAPGALLAALRGKPDIVLSDMAAPTTGHRKTDHLRTMHLFEVAAEFARQNLVEGGAFLSKVFRGGTEGTLLAELKRDFAMVAHVKPPASRKESPELYVLAKGFRGRPRQDDDD